MIVGVREFLRNAAACLQAGTIETLPAKDRWSMLDAAQMWMDAAVIADGGVKPERMQPRRAGER